MSAISMMELNTKSPFLWDLENLVMFNAKVEQAPKTLQFVESEIEGLEGFEVSSFYSSSGPSDGGTGYDLGYASLSRSSKSASDDSSTDREIKETQFSLETMDLRRKREFVKYELTRTSPTIESSVASGESLTALELCNRTYFEDISEDSNLKNTNLTFVPPDSNAKKSKSSLGLENSLCQVEGCNVDLSSAKSYHRKHKVCENHSKSPRVVINGRERRFCQQCSRFHSLSEFDQKKRSCRNRLSDHNSRRRKPKQEVIQFNTMTLASSLYEGRNQLNFGFNEVPMLQTRHDAWDSTRGSKVTLAKSGLYSRKTIKEGTNDLHCTQNGLQSPVTKVSPVSTHFLPSKVPPSEIFHRGLLASVTQSNMEAAQDLRALSLLSTTTWGSPSSTQPLMAMHAVPLGGPHVPSQPAASELGSHISSFQLFKAPNDSSFYLY